MDNTFASHFKPNVAEIVGDTSTAAVEGHIQDISTKSAVLAQSNMMEVNGNISTESRQLHDPWYGTSNNTTDTSYPNAISNTESNLLQQTLFETKETQKYVPVVDGNISGGEVAESQNYVPVVDVCSISGGEVVESQKYVPVVDVCSISGGEVAESQKYVPVVDGSISGGDPFKPEYVEEEKPMNTSTTKYDIGVDDGIKDAVLAEEPKQNYEGIQENVLPVVTNTDTLNSQELDSTENVTNKTVYGSYPDTEVVAPDSIQASSQKITETSNEPICERLEETEKNLTSFSPSASFHDEEVGNAENVIQETTEKPHVFSVQDLDSSQEIIEETPEVTSINSFTLIAETIEEDNILGDSTNLEISEELHVQTSTDNNMAISEHIEIIKMGNVETDGNIVGKDNDSDVLFEQVEVQVEEIGVSVSTKPMLAAIEQTENSNMNIPSESETSFPVEFLPSAEESDLLESMKEVSLLKENETVAILNQEMTLVEDKHDDIVDMAVKVETIVNEPGEDISVESMVSPKIIAESLTIKKENEVKITNLEEAEENRVPPKKLQIEEIKACSAVTDKKAMKISTDIKAKVSSNESIKASLEKPKEATTVGSLEMKTNVTTKDDRRERKQKDIVSREVKQTPKAKIEHNSLRATDSLTSNRKKNKKEIKMKLSQDAFNEATEILKTVISKQNTYGDGVYVHPKHQVYATEIKDGEINLLKCMLSDGQLSADSNHYEHLKSCRIQNGNDYINLKVNGRKRRKMVGRFVYECCNNISLLENIVINYNDGNKRNQNPSNLSIVIQPSGGRTEVNHS